MFCTSRVVFRLASGHGAAKAKYEDKCDSSQDIADKLPNQGNRQYCRQSNPENQWWFEGFVAHAN
ncbi:MAG: hypothetical protein WCW26_05225 [Candidatus Buchananbacteria bacterium]